MKGTKLLVSIFFLIILICSSVGSFAQTQADELSTDLQWWPATPEQIQSAPCRRMLPLTDIEIESGIRTLIPVGDKTISQNVFGLQIKNESAYLVGLLKRLLQSREGHSEDQILFSSSCSSVLCAVKEPHIFGPYLGPRLLFMLGRYGFNGSPYATFNSENWKEDEIDDVLIALNDFPPNLFPLEKNKQLTHFKRGYTMSGYKDESKVVTVANSFIFVFDGWDSLNRSHRQSTIVHEMGHYFASRYLLDMSSTWLSFSDWMPQSHSEIQTSEQNYEKNDDQNLNNDLQMMLGKPEAIVSKYGQQNPMEDFAESVVAYRYNPSLLKTKSLQKYRFLREVLFDGLEYFSEDQCHSNLAFSKRLQERSLADIHTVLADPFKFDELIKDISNKCGAEILDQFTSEYIMPYISFLEARECLEKNISSFSSAQAPQMQRLRYKTLSQKAVQDRVRGIPSDYSLLTKVQIQLWYNLEKVFTEVMRRVEREAAVFYKASTYTESIEKFCDAYSGTVYSVLNSVEDFSLGFDQLLKNDYTLFPNGYQVMVDFAKQFCMDLHSGWGPIVPKNDWEIQDAIRKRFPIY